MKKYRSERKGRRSFDTAIEYGRVAMLAREKTRTGARHRSYTIRRRSERRGRAPCSDSVLYCQRGGTPCLTFRNSKLCSSSVTS
jgi:hypothetical protein